MLMPCLFLCDEQGFFEPTLRKMFAQGRPFMSPAKFDKNISVFLEQIWKEYGSWSLAQFKHLITRLPLYTSCYHQGVTTVLSWNSLIDKSMEYGTMYESGKSNFKTKVLVSQNGPVVVSQWTPRKVSNKDGFDE